MKSFAMMLHSLTSNLQQVTAHVTPVLGAVVAHQEVAHAVGVEGQSVLHAFVTSGALHEGLVAGLLPLASVLNAAFECGLGLSKIGLALLYFNKELQSGGRMTDEGQNRTRLQLAARGAWEIAGSIAPGTLGILALESLNAPLACLSFAISSYTKAITQAWDCYSNRRHGGKEVNKDMMRALLSVVDGTGWLLLNFGIPAGGALLAMSFIAKRCLSTGTLAQNLQADKARASHWCSTLFPSSGAVDSSPDLSSLPCIPAVPAFRPAR